MLVISSTAFALAALVSTVTALPQPQIPNTGSNIQPLPQPQDPNSGGNALPQPQDPNAGGNALPQPQGPNAGGDSPPQLPQPQGQDSGNNTQPALSQPQGSKSGANTQPPPQSQTPNTGGSAVPATDLCGADQHVILDGTPWLVANSMYGAGSMVGTSCTHYDHIEDSQVVWSSTVHIQNVEATNNICKGYANVGVVGNLEHQISSISSIPATYDWTRTNSSPFKGNICFDFILGATKGDSTSSAAQELMLWLEWEGGQLPIGWDAGPKATIGSLFGTSWKVYEGVNTGNGMTVHSMLPDTQFSGSFAGDLKDWFEALVKAGRFTDAMFVNIGNAGSEIFWGDSVLQASLGVQINSA